LAVKHAVMQSLILLQVDGVESKDTWTETLLTGWHYKWHCAITRYYRHTERCWWRSKISICSCSSNNAACGQSINCVREEQSGLRVWFVGVLAVKLSQRLELVNKGAVLTLEHHNTHLEARDVLLLLSPTHTCRFTTDVTYTQTALLYNCCS